jgi:spore coat protein U-like protein
MKLTAKLGLAAALILVTGQAYASTTTGTFTAQLSITAQCTIVSTQTLDFGTNGVINANIDQTSTLNVQCTNTTPYNIGLDAGANGGTTTTRLLKGGPSNETIQYKLFSNAGRTTNWGETIGTDTVTGTGNGASQPFTIYGRVPPQTTPTPGAYSDTVTVTVTY